jgi:hypothetical protein
MRYVADTQLSNFATASIVLRFRFARGRSSWATALQQPFFLRVIGDRSTES